MKERDPSLCLAHVLESIVDMPSDPGGLAPVERPAGEGLGQQGLDPMEAAWG